ncbi:hypothetical protein FQA39_LY14103 [Lamprigera yunnana]|nr:hypothetical protein FQA39_LY14103 [Lamprigera yunnana]
MFHLLSKSKLFSTYFKTNSLKSRRDIFWYKEPKPEPFKLELAKRVDYCNIVDILWKCYYNDEPTCAALKVGYKYNSIFDEMVMKYLSEGLTYVVKCKYTGELIGGCINTVACRWEPDDLDKMACKTDILQIRYLYQFRAYVQRLPCFWDKYCTDKVFEKAKSFLIVRAKPQDYCCVADMLWKYFYPDEPTILSLGLGTNYNPLFDEETLRDLAEGLSVLAKCKYSGNIIGGCINISSCPWDPDQYDKIAVSVSCPRLKKLYAFYAFLQRAPCLWERYCTNRVYEMKTLFVDTENRSKGMGHVLLEASRSLGINNGFKVIRCDATSYFTYVMFRDILDAS